MAEDPIARREAALANQKIDSHEDRCSERWGEARTELKTLHTRVSETKELINTTVRKGLWVFIGAQGSVILLLLGTLIAMVTKA